MINPLISSFNFLIIELVKALSKIYKILLTLKVCTRTCTCMSTHRGTLPLKGPWRSTAEEDRRILSREFWVLEQTSLLFALAHNFIIALFLQTSEGIFPITAAGASTNAPTLGGRAAPSSSSSVPYGEPITASNGDVHISKLGTKASETHAWSTSGIPVVAVRVRTLLNSWRPATVTGDSPNGSRRSERHWCLSISPAVKSIDINTNKRVLLNGRPTMILVLLNPCQRCSNLHGSLTLVGWMQIIPTSLCKERMTRYKLTLKLHNNKINDKHNHILRWTQKSELVPVNTRAECNFHRHGPLNWAIPFDDQLWGWQWLTRPFSMQKRDEFC